MLTDIWALIKQYPETSIALGSLFVVGIYYISNRLKLLFFGKEQDATEEYVDGQIRECVEKVYNVKTRLYKEQNGGKLTLEQIKEIRTMVKKLVNSTIGNDMKAIVRKSIPDLDAYVEVNLDLIYDEFKLSIAKEDSTPNK